ncbi:MAG: hypothetical protein J5563_05985 [Clostridia bacterium]|nr:hypothetical protein [Clostridia bacterium]
MKKILVLLLLAALALAGCAPKNGALTPSETHEKTQAYENLVLQIGLSRELWSRGQSAYAPELLDRLAEAGKNAVSVSQDPDSTDDECENARKHLKAVTEEVKNSLVTMSALKEFAALIQTAENALPSFGGEKADELRTAINEAYGVYSTSSTASQIQEASAKLRKLLK